MMRLGLAEAITGERGLQLAGEASNCDQALELCQQLRPDVITMDLHLPKTDGAETLRRIRQADPNARIIVFSVSESEEDIWRVAEAGAMAYVPKSADIEEVLEAIREVHDGRTYFPCTIAEKLAARRDRETLTPREMQVLQEVVRGKRNKEIVCALHMSEATVKLHVSNILGKLGVADRTQAAIVAVQRGIVRLVD